ncbi:MAG TPA: hypothetical protein PKH07_11360, partial [bacterium]|nr:hypothetical protein [bacterium]
PAQNSALAFASSDKAFFAQMGTRVFPERIISLSFHVPKCRHPKRDRETTNATLMNCQTSRSNELLTTQSLPYHGTYEFSVGRTRDIIHVWKEVVNITSNEGDYSSFLDCPSDPI